MLGGGKRREYFPRQARDQQHERDVMKKAIAMGLMGMGFVLGVWAGCNSPNNIRVTVDITAPTAGKQLTMSAVDAAFTTLTAKSSGDDDNQLKWTFTGFIFPAGDDGNKGTPIDVKTPATWPVDNSFWGEKTVRLEYSGGDEGDTSDCHDEVAVKVFFEPVVDIGSEPAWFKYWKDGVIKDLSEFSALSENDPVFEIEEGDVAGAYDPDPQECSTGVLSALFRFTWYEVGSDEMLAINKDSFLGLADVAETVGHELKHQDLHHGVSNAYSHIWAEFVMGSISQSEMFNQFDDVDRDND